MIAGSWRRLTIFGVAAVAIVGVLQVDPDSRGPLATAADLWLAEHDEEAQEFFARGAAALRDGGVDPAPFELSLDLSVRGDGSDQTRAFTLLDRLARGERAKSLYRTLWLARAGRRDDARRALETIEEATRPPRVHAIASLLDG